MVTSNLYFNRVTQRSKADQLYRGSHQDPHLQEASSEFRRQAQLSHHRVGAGRQGAEGLELRRHQLALGGADRLRFNMFHENGFSKVLTQGKPRIADHANHALLGADQTNLLIFSKANLPKALADLRRRTELTNPHPGPGFHPIEWAKGRGGTGM